MSDEEAPKPGHNSELTEAEKRALFLKSLADLEAHIEEKNEVVAGIRNIRKRMIGYGFKSYEIDYALKLRKQEDAEMIERRRAEARIAQFLNHPIGVQLDWVEQEDRTPAVDNAYENGKVAGSRAETARSPHAPGTEQDQSWLKGWNDAQGDLASGFRKLEAEPAPEMEAA